MTQRGTAGTAAQCTVNPLASLSRPLLIPQPNAEPLELGWRSVDELKALPEGYLSVIKSKRVFAIGGLQLVIECGLVADWYNNDVTRRDALDLIEQRGARELFDLLADKDQPTSIFGKNDLRGFFKTFPPVRRDEVYKDRELGSTRQVRKEHPLRLRKVLEFLFLTEAVLRYRFRLKETMSRFEDVTGVKVTSPDSAIALWEYMWAEPLLYVLDPSPRSADITRIMTPARLGPFASSSGQREDVLYWALVGVPSTYETAAAAAAACNSFYPTEAAATYAVTVAPKLHDARLDLLMDETTGPRFLKSIEDVVRLMP